MRNLFSTTAAVVAGVAVVLGLVGSAAATAAPAGPAPSPAVASSPCPPVTGGANYVRFEPDPANPNAYYVCAGVVPQRHVVCPPNTTLQWIGPPPVCAPRPANS